VVITVISPLVIPLRPGTFTCYKLKVHCEASLNHLVQLSICNQLITWVSLDAAFPTIPLHLSEVCRDFQFHTACLYPPADQKRLVACFMGAVIKQHQLSGTTLLLSDASPMACRGVDATGTISPLFEQVEWLITILRKFTHRRLKCIEMVMLLIPVPHVLADITVVVD
jgi:hypothetical protein